MTSSQPSPFGQEITTKLTQRNKETFTRSKLDWPAVQEEPSDWLEYHRRLIRLHRDIVVSHLAGISGHAGKFDLLGPRALHVSWCLTEGDRLNLYANLNSELVSEGAPVGEPFFATHPDVSQEDLPPWGVLWTLEKMPGDKSESPGLIESL